MSKARDLANAGTALTTVSATELGYLDGVTSAVQTQIDSKIGSASAINPTIVDAKGDIIAATAADTVARLAVGANDTVLTADSSTATGLKWATPASGGMTLLSTTSLSGTTTTISNINQNYNSLFIIVYGVLANTANEDFVIRPNGSTNSCTYSGVRRAPGGTPQVAGTNDDEMNLSFFYGTDRTSSANAWSVQIDNYASSASLKPFRFQGSWVNAGRYSSNFAGGFTSDTAITSLTFRYAGYSMTAGTVLLYGVK